MSNFQHFTLYAAWPEVEFLDEIYHKSLKNFKHGKLFKSLTKLILTLIKNYKSSGLKLRKLSDSLCFPKLTDLVCWKTGNKFSLFRCIQNKIKKCNCLRKKKPESGVLSQIPNLEWLHNHLVVWKEDIFIIYFDNFYCLTLNLHISLFLQEKVSFNWL